MKFVRKVSMFFLCISLVLACNLNVLAEIECDGLVKQYEWSGVEVHKLFSSNDHSGCDYNSAYARVKFLEENRRVYFALNLENNKSALENAVNYIIVSFNNSTDIILCSDGSSKYDEDKFDVDFGCSYDSFGGCSYEADFALKETDYSEYLYMYVSICDYNGNTSQKYELLIKSKELLESESKSEKESEKESNKEKTTKKKATKKLKQKPLKLKLQSKKQLRKQKLQLHMKH